MVESNLGTGKDAVKYLLKKIFQYLIQEKISVCSNKVSKTCCLINIFSKMSTLLSSANKLQTKSIPSALHCHYTNLDNTT